MRHDLSLHENLLKGSTHEALHFIEHEQGLIMHRNMASINTTWHIEENRFLDLVKIRLDMAISFYLVGMLT